jgi:hypothetical protein
MLAVSNGPDGMVAAGVVNATDGVVWRSADGDTWEIIGDGKLFDLGSCPSGCPSLTSIASGPAGIAVTGYRTGGPDSGGFQETDVWFSPDGGTWTRTALPIPPGSSLRPAAEAWVVTSTRGFLVAGTVCKADGLWPGCEAVTWESVDGREWSAPAGLPEGGSSGAKGIETSPERQVVIGQRCGDACSARVWTADEQGRWAPGDLRGIGEVGAGQGTLTAAGATFLVFGTRAGQPSLWASEDGQTWVRRALPEAAFPSDPGFMLLDAAGAPGRVMVVGVYDESEQPAVWISP